MHSPEDPLVGKVLAGQFRVARCLGEGGMGALYLAEQLEVDRLVAIKVVHTHFAELRAEALERFKLEARALAQINHPNVVQLYALGQTDEGQWFLAMEYVAGRTLAEEVRQGALEQARALRIATHIADALAAAHARGVIHRDLKPANVMLQGSLRDEQVKVVDFGIAKMLDASANITSTGSFFGTPRYAAPEQARSQAVDGRTDVYALGLVLYEMLTGDVPFTADTPFDQLIQQVAERPDPPSLRRDGLAPELDALVLRCLEKEPEQRYASASALGDALRTLMAQLAGPRAISPSPVLPAPLHVPAPAALPAPVPVATSDEEAEEAEEEEDPPEPPRKPDPWFWPGVRRVAFIAFTAMPALLTVWMVNFHGADTLAAWRDRLSHAPLTEAVVDGVDALNEKVDPSAHPSPRRAGVLADPAQAGVIRFCLNLHGPRFYDSMWRYLAFAPRQSGPTHPERNTRAVLTLDDVAACKSNVAALQVEQPITTEAKAYLSALLVLAPLLERANAYYQYEGFRQDDLAQGKALHTELLSAYDAQWRADRTLRSALAPVDEARDAKLLQYLEPPAYATDRVVHALRVAQRTLLALLNRPLDQLRAIALKDFDARFAQLAARGDQLVQHVAQAEVAPAERGELKALINASQALLHAAHASRRLIAAEGKAQREGSTLGAARIEGSPAALLAPAKSLVQALNQTQALKRYGIVEPIPVWSEH